MPLDFVRKAIQEGFPLGLKSIKLTGGEPTLHPQFHEIVKMIGHLGFNIQIETNGVLIDSELAHFMKNNINHLFIAVSIDGADLATHESLRMVKGSFNDAINGINNLVKVGIHPQMICTLYKGNFHQLEDIAKLADKLGCSSVKLNHIQRSGRGETLAENEGLKVKELLEINSFIEKKLSQSLGIPIMLDLPLAFRPPRYFLDQNLGLCRVLNILGILANGEISLCGIGVTEKGLIFGHIIKDNLADIWCNASGIEKLRKLVPFGLDGICSECIHRDICLGNCIANSFKLYGKINSSYYFCHEAEQSNLFPKSRRRFS